MKKLLSFVVLSFFPLFVFAADGSLSFAPPPGDYSVIFLGNLFGVVDGVLHGTGSQIMGTMFGVFNAAVLALGGIIIMYTLMVSTMNTAHEGQMLGQKWSSIWIPVRSTIGLALLIPKASGYCLMQIFVMWIVVQGVGAADKVWEAALSYLNRGGVIIKAQANPGTALTMAIDTGIPSAALTILSGQVCMLGLQKQLEKQRQNFLSLKQNKRGPCYGTPSYEMKSFCDTPVPDFIGTVNAVSVQSRAMSRKGSLPSEYQVLMPFGDVDPYSSLNGLCGIIKWNNIEQIAGIKNPGTGGGVTSVGLIGGISSSELETAQMSRAIAIQQMYLDLSLVAQIIVNNSPEFSTIDTSTSGTNNNFAPFAKQQFGVPYTDQGAVCSKYDLNCVLWGPAASGDTNSAAVLFSGTEFQGAIADYNGIMMPTLNLIKQSRESLTAGAARKFITEAKARGWIMAGSYFFDLVKLNGDAVKDTDLTDKDTGLERSEFSSDKLTSVFTKDGCKLGYSYTKLCTWFEGKSDDLAKVQSLIDGSVPGDSGSKPVAKPQLEQNASREIVGGLDSSTVYGFVNNSLMMQIPGQPGIAPLQFANMIKFSVDTTPYRLQKQDFDCGRVRITFFSFCLGEMFGNLFYNIILLNMYNFFMAIFQQIINQVIMAFLMIPLEGMAGIFKQGVETISTPGVNPVVALANMGTMYINFSGNLWIMLLSLSVSSAIIPIFGIFVFALIAMAMPLLLAWVGIMVSIGFTTAYYVPILPYMIFTFGSIAWLISVIEAMVAAPIVALGVTHPEGHDAFGKGEAAIMILMNVFLRPAMMIIGYISAIALCYVGIWILNAGFDHAIGFIQDGNAIALNKDTSGGNALGVHNGLQMETQDFDQAVKEGGAAGYNAWNQSAGSVAGTGGSGSGGYTEWAGIYAFFFSILIYTTMYLVIVQRAFTLITYLPDKVLRWIGGSPESLGSEASQWGDELKKSTTDAGEKTQSAQAQMDKQVSGGAQQMISGGKSAGQSGMSGKGGASAEGGGGGEATPSAPAAPPIE